MEEEPRKAPIKVHDKRGSSAAPGTSIPSSGTPAPSASESPPEATEHDYLEDLRRLQADFENYRKRMMKQQAEISSRAVAGLIEHLLPVLDNFERALAHGEGGTGVELALKEMTGILERSGLEEIPAKGVAFDPNVHEAVEHRVSPDVAEPTVVDVFRTGYKLGDRVLRPAMVAVAEHAAENPDVTSDAAEG